MLKKSAISIFLIMLFSAQAMAEEKQKTIDLSMQETIAIALKNNLDLKISSYTPELKMLDLQKIYDEFGISVGFRPNLQNNLRPTSNSFISGGAVLNEFNQSYDFYANKKFMSNGELTLNFQNSVSNTNSTRVDLNPAITPRLSLNFDQPLLRNAFNGYRRVEIGKNESEASELRLKSQALELVNQVQQAYWNLVLNREKLKVLENSLKLAKDLLEINQEKEKAGLISKMDVLATEASIASKEEGLLQGKKALEESQDSLKKLLNPDSDALDWYITVNPTENTVITKLNPDFEKSYQTSLEKRPDYQAALIDSKSLEIQKNIASQNRLPELSLNGSAGITSLDKDYLNSLQSLLTFKNYSWNLGLNVAIPVVGNVYETEYKQSLINQKKQQDIIKNLQQQITNDLRNSIRNIQINARRVDANRISQELVREQVKAETEKLGLGLSTNFQVLQFQEDLQEASLNEVNARIDYLKSLNNFSRVKGTNLEENNIIWDTTLPGSELKE